MPRQTWRHLFAAGLHATALALALLGCPASLAAAAIAGPRALPWVWIVVVPLALIIGLISALAARRDQLIRARLRQHLCPACGYDLRASKACCPECGRKIAFLNSPPPIRP